MFLIMSYMTKNCSTIDFFLREPTNTFVVCSSDHRVLAYRVTQKSDRISETNILKLLQDINDDPESYDAFVNGWNALFDSSQQGEKNAFADVEAAALSSVVSDEGVVPKSNVGFRIGHLLEQFDSPVYLVKRNGEISAQNDIALKTYKLGIEDSIDDLPFDLALSEPITKAISASLSPGRNSHDAVLKRAFSKTSDSTATLSISPSNSKDGNLTQALVFVIDARWKTRAAGLITREFDLSPTEQELLVSFLDGESTQSMAETRERSHTTIRTQFYSLMGKMGAKTQTELLRNALSVSQFVDQVDEIAEIIRHPHRKRVDLVRPKGRSVEVTMAGDWAGEPIVFLQSGISYTFESKIEQAFHDAGYCILSMCRPGYGDTDPAPHGEEAYETYAADLNSLLDQLGHEKCLLMSSNLSSAVMYALSPYISERIKGLIQVAAPGPIKYHQDQGTSVTWANGIINAVNRHPKVHSFLLNTGIRTWKTLGQARFRKMAFKINAKEYELATRPEALQDAQIALDTATKQGYDVLVSDMTAIFSDFREEVNSTQLPILALHGSDDPVFEIDALRKFAKDYVSRMTFIELPGAGFSVMASHADDIMRHIAEFDKTI